MEKQKEKLEYKDFTGNDVKPVLYESLIGKEVYYAGAFYEVAEIKDFPHGKMIGIYDEKPSNHIDYINPKNVKEVLPCYACQGGGCPVCGGYGKLIN